MKRLLLLIVFFAATFFALQAQNVSNVAFRQEGDKVEVSYVLDAPADVQLMVSTDGGATFTKALKHVSGDVGYGVSAGLKHIEWDALAEMGDLVSNSVVFQIAAYAPFRTYTLQSFKGKGGKNVEKEYLDYTRQHCYDAYKMYKRGRQNYRSGAGLVATGTILMGVSAAAVGYSFSLWDGRYFLYGGIAGMACGFVMDVVGIPLMTSSKKLKRNSINHYNTRCNNTLSMQLNYTGDGVGVALNF